MSDYAHTRAGLRALVTAVQHGTMAIPPNQRLWGGAGVVITDTPPAEPDPGAFYPPPQYVVTPHAAPLSWLFEQLRDAFAWLVDWSNKAEFYGRLADAAAAQQRRSERELLMAVLAEAMAILGEMQG